MRFLTESFKNADQSAFSICIGLIIQFSLLMSQSTMAAFEVRGVKAKFNGLVGLETQSYFFKDSSTKTTQALNMLQVEAHQNYLSESFENRLSLDGAGTVNGNEKQAYLNVPELFSAYRVTENFQAGVGRRIFAWNELDSEWKTGFFQPLSQQDPLRAQEGGLTGVHFDYSTTNFQFSLVPVSIFVPSLGPQIEERDNKIVSPSPWFRTPRNQVYLSKKVPTEIRYNVVVPDTNQVVNNNGSAARGVIGNKNDGVWMQTSWAHKPLSQLSFEYERVLLVNSTTSPYADVQIRPQVAYHQVYGADLGWTGSRSRVSVSYFGDKPEDMDHQKDWVHQSVEPAKAWGGEADYALTYLNGQPVTASVGFMRIDGGKTYDVDPKGGRVHSLLGDRFLFSDAAKIKLSGSFLRVFKKNLYSSFQYLYDQEQKGGWANAEFKYFASQTLALHMGADVLGISTRTPAVQDGFLNQYRSNDRLYTGLSYVF